MKFTYFLGSVLALVTTLSNSVASIEPLIGEGEYPCKTILNETSGVLRYNPFGYGKKYDRCVWILRAPATSGYTIRLYWKGYRGVEEKNALHIASVRHGVHTLESTTPSEIDTDYFINGSVSILTYYSNDRPGGGFALHWIAHSDNSTAVSPNSVTEIVTTIPRNISHPKLTSGLEKYDNNEVSTFLFAPDEYSDENSVTFVQHGLQRITCNDFIDVFKFKVGYYSDEDTGWSNYYRFCGPDTGFSFNVDYPVLVVFQSDASETNSGFDLIFRNKYDDTTDVPWI